MQPKQFDLLGTPGEGTPEPAPFQRHSETSLRAAGEITPYLSNLQQRVYDMLLQCGPLGATDEDMQRFLNMNPSSQRPRRIELVAKGLVIDTGKTRKTRAGRQATVWKVNRAL
jgi:hypothetical protein